ncbi:MAG: site-specific integrase [Bacteroidales bacterium]|nr:site-specific integrase [Bacteroidales bacterium]
MITQKIVFDRRKTASRTREGYVEVRVTIDRMTKYISTGVRVYKNEWAADRVVNRRDAQALNDRLAIIFEKVYQAATESVKQGVKLDTESVKQAVWQFVESQTDDPTFVSWCKKQIPLLGISDGTAKHYKPLITKLTEYGKMKKWQDLTVENIANFDAWLHQQTKPLSDARRKAGAKPEKLSDAAVYNYHKCLKALLNRALSFGKIDANPYDRLKGKFKRGERENPEYLTEDEMKRFEAIILPQGSELDVVHDLFIFQMYTGLPYSDMQAFDASDYKYDGETWRRVGERIKTGVPYVSQLLPPAVKVLEKYGWEIPQLSNADYNRHLKALGQMAGIKTRLHSHLARHTFATWMLSHDIPIEHVSKMLGHTNITQTQRYAKVLAQSVYDDFSKVAAKMTPSKRKRKDKGE